MWILCRRVIVGRLGGRGWEGKERGEGWSELDAIASASWIDGWMGWLFLSIL